MLWWFLQWSPCRNSFQIICRNYYFTDVCFINDSIAEAMRLRQSPVACAQWHSRPEIFSHNRRAAGRMVWMGVNRDSGHFWKQYRQHFTNGLVYDDGIGLHVRDARWCWSIVTWISKDMFTSWNSMHLTDFFPKIPLRKILMFLQNYCNQSQPPLKCFRI